MKTGIFVAALLLVHFATNSAFAAQLAPFHSQIECDQILTLYPEFALVPNDLQKGFVTASYPITSDSVLAAYNLGLFPWDVTSRGTGEWYSLPERGVLDFSDLRIPRSHRKAIQKMLQAGSGYIVTFDHDFAGVIQACQTMNRGQGTSWISNDFIKTWVDLHQMGAAHSVEVWHSGLLVAGLYGTMVNGVYSGESMFHLEGDVGKLAYFTLIEELKKQGLTWIDTQQNVGLTQAWGGKLISRTAYQERLKSAHDAYLSHKSSTLGQ